MPDTLLENQNASRRLKPAPPAGVVMLAGPGRSTRIVYHALAREFSIHAVIIEDAVARAPFLVRRIKKLGFAAVAGQILFRSLAAPWLARSARQRIAEIKTQWKLDDSPIEPEKIVRVRSVNSPEAIEALKRLDPAVVIVNGTRIISKKTLDAARAVFINTHAGITPRYRGVHGAYWALVEGNRGACGVTVHRVDSGIDTGPVLAQSTIDPSGNDNFATYPLLQLAAGLPELRKAARNAINGGAPALDPPAMESKLWSHPTLWQYFRYRWQKGVR